MKIYLTLLITLTIAGQSFSQQLQVAKNRTFEITNRTIDTLTGKTDESFTYAFRSLGKNLEGNNVFDCRIVKAIIKNDKKVLLNTDSLRKTNFMSTGVLFPIAMLNKPFTLIINNKGKVIRINDLQEQLKSTLIKWNLNSDIEKQILNNAEGGFAAEMQGLFYQFPNKALTTQTSWENKDTGTKFKIISNKAGVLRLNTEETRKDGSTNSSKYSFDPKTGLMLSQFSKTNFTSKIKNLSSGTEKSAKGEVINIKKLSNATTITKPDSNWINMAVKLSYWSEELKTGGEYDSLKVKKAIATFGPQFKNDAYYAAKKLSLIQQTRNDHNYQVYWDALMETPNEYLKDESSHLLNKLGTALEKGSAADAYAVSKYLYNTPSFTSWIQQSFAQNFIGEYDYKGRKEMDRKSAELIQMFVSNKNPVYRQKTRALNLWVKAKADSKNTALQLETATAFNKMSDQEMKEGNGGRYALLMYNLLLDLNKKGAADSLLSAVIVKLQKYTTDSLNKERYESQNMLAHAYYLKFLSVVKTDSVKAMAYLGEASEYSPKNNKEKAHGSFYDRVFLKSKESYRDDYIDQLLIAGNEQEALKLLAVQINSSPETLSDMQKRFETKFPSRSFKTFFTEHIISTWQNAPEFKVKNINGKEHTLSDFKDKWLVLDFWGTWCGPCKQELPDVNTFYTELTEGKHGDANFLSVACYDTEEKVKGFLALNKYTIPVAMSDNKIENDYKVSGYPSKIIISPDGRMLNVQFGKDWKGILKKFNEIYASK
jgi:thiol-disulfide isomerase/thioredoxin